MGSVTMTADMSSFREVLHAEFEQRRARNIRYSVRRFAGALGVDHATLARLLKSVGPIAPRTVRRLGVRLHLAIDEIEAMVRREEEQIVASAVARPRFRPDSRWLATQTGLNVDTVNASLQSLLRTGRLQMRSREQWTVKER